MHFLSVNSLCKFYCYFSLEIGTYCVIPCHSRLRGLPLEVEKLIELIEYFLTEGLFVGGILSIFGLPFLLIFPEGFRCLTLSLASGSSIIFPILTRHRPSVSPIEIVVFLFRIVVLVIREYSAILSTFLMLLMLVIVPKRPTITTTFLPKPMSVVIDLLL